VCPRLGLGFGDGTVEVISMRVQRVGTNSFVQTMGSAFVQQWSFGSLIDLYYGRCLVRRDSEYYGRGCFDSAWCCCYCVCSGLLLSQCMFPLFRQACGLRCSVRKLA
jgi:hypothetical protein